VTIIILGIASIVGSWAIYYLIALVADSIYGKWRRFFFLVTIVYSIVLPFWIYEKWADALVTSFLFSMILAFGESVLVRHIRDKMEFDELVITKIEDLERAVDELKNNK